MRGVASKVMGKADLVPVFTPRLIHPELSDMQRLYTAALHSRAHTLTHTHFPGLYLAANSWKVRNSTKKRKEGL